MGEEGSWEKKAPGRKWLPGEKSSEEKVSRRVGVPKREAPWREMRLGEGHKG
jgi:hypothetical protein